MKDDDRGPVPAKPLSLILTYAVLITAVVLIAVRTTDDDPPSERRVVADGPITSQRGPHRPGDGRRHTPPAQRGRISTGAVRSYRGMWISTAEVARLPKSGAAWRYLKGIADSNIGVANIKGQGNLHPARTYGVALVYARTGEAKYRAKTRVAILSAIGTEAGARSLAVGRNLAAYVFAADLINLPQMDPTGAARFRSWIAAMRNTENTGNRRWRTLVETSERTANNWGAFANASRIAIDLYLGDEADLQRAAAIHLAYADRSAYPSGEPWGDYFEPTNDFDPEHWSCGDATNWTAVNPPCTKNGYDIGGAFVEDISREEDGRTVLPQPADSKGVSYSWETLQAMVVQAELLRRAKLPNLWERSGQAIRRATAFIQRAGWQEPVPVASYVPWMLNARYGSHLPTQRAEYGRLVGFTDWTHARRGR